MGFASFGTSVAGSALSNAVDFAGDLAPLLGLLAGLGAAGVLVSIFSRFVAR